MSKRTKTRPQKWIVSGEMEILKITQRQHNTHTKTVLRDKFVKSNWFGCADFAGEIGGWCDKCCSTDFREEPDCMGKTFGKQVRIPPVMAVPRKYLRVG
jgi:hypothetical protein